MTDNLEELERRYLLLKRGLYYAPDNNGYTGIKEHAGRYYASDAGNDVSAIHEDKAPQFSPACFEDVKVKYLNDRLIATAREVEGLRAEVARLRERWAMIDQLRGAEGCSVEIIHDNPDPGGSNCAIYVTDNFGEDYSTYYGDTVDDCLKQAIAARAALEGKGG